MRVAIVGAGIGGLAAAVALDRAGLRVDVYEQATQPLDVGAGLHLAPNGSRVLHRWGLGAALDRDGVRAATTEVRDWRTDQVLAAEPMGEVWEAKYGAPHYTIHRAHLHRILAERVPAGRVHFDRTLVAIADTTDGVRLRFADSTTADCDVLVGADGVHSVVRRHVAGPDRGVFSGNSAFRGLVPAEAVPTLPARTVLLWPGPRNRLLSYPVDDGRSLTFVAVVPDPAGSRESWSEAGKAAGLAAAFEGWSPDACALVEAVTEPRRWALYDREPLSNWGSGRITLLGDAAHPMLPHHGQGASQALEDAVALAHCLAGTPAGVSREQVAARLDRYQAVRRPHTAKVQVGSRGGGSLRLGSAGAAGNDAVPRSGPAGHTISALVEDVSWIQRYDVEAEFEPVRAPAILSPVSGH